MTEDLPKRAPGEQHPRLHPLFPTPWDGWFLPTESWSEDWPGSDPDSSASSASSEADDHDEDGADDCDRSGCSGRENDECESAGHPGV